MLFSTLIFLFISLASARIDGQNDYGGNARRVNVADSEVLQMYQKWVDTGLSSLMAAVADKRLKKQRSAVAHQFGKCSSKADSIPKQARCVNQLLQNKMVDEEERRKRLKVPHRLQRYGISKSTSEQKWDGPFRMQKRRKRELPVSRSRYDLLPTNGQVTPLGGIAKLILQSVLEKHNKTTAPGWQTTIQRLQESADRKKMLRKRLEDESHESLNQLAMRGLKKMQPADGLNAEDIQDRQKITEFVKKARRTKPRKPEEYLMYTLREAMKLGYSLAGKNTSNFDEKSVKLVSPRFFGLVPEEKQPDEVNLLSPSLFSLHRDGVGVENITSVFNLLQGLPLKDQHIWLDMIMEATGVNDAADNLQKEVVEEEQKQQESQTQLFNPAELKDDYGTPLYFEKHNATRIGGSFETRKIETFEALHRSYTKEQLHAMNTTGYAYLNREQLQNLYGANSPYNNSRELQKFLGMSGDKMDDHLEKDIATLSQLDKFNVKQRDIVLSPILFTFLTLVPGLASQPLVLSPVIFSPLILSPSVFGAVILSPWMFVPLVLSPRVLGALILSPFVFAPLILTPLVLHPAILSPGVFNPFYFDTDHFVSAGVYPADTFPTCPFSDHPESLVLSPIIASPQVLGGLFLSPYVLSPVLLSPLIAFAAILSPSFLS